MKNDIIFYIPEPREYAECYRYALSKWFYTKHKHEWMTCTTALEKKIEEDHGEYHKHFNAFKYIKINYMHRESKRELQMWHYSETNTIIWWMKEFKMIVDFLERCWTHIINDVKKSSLYYFKTSTDRVLRTHFWELEKM